MACDTMALQPIHLILFVNAKFPIYNKVFHKV